MGSFGKRFAECRRAAGLKQTAAAKLIGISQPTLSQYENDVFEPTVSVLVGMCLAYHVTMDYLLGLTDVNEKVDRRG